MALFGKQKKKLADQYLQVLESLYHEDYPQALEVLKDSVSKYTDQPVPYLWLGRLLFEKGEINRAEIIYRNLALRPRLSKKISSAAWRAAAQCSRRLEHFENQIEALGNYIRISPKDTLAAAEYFYAKAKQALSHQNRDGATNYLYESISADKRFGKAFILLGDLLEEESPERGLRIWRRLLKARPDLIQTLQGRFRDAYKTIEKPDRFEKFLKQLCSRSPVAGFPYLVLARYYLEIGETEEAKQAFLEAKTRPATKQIALAEINKINIDRWDQKGALELSDELLNSLNEPGFLWRCNNCSNMKTVPFLEHCDICENWVEISTVQGK
ncbi:tetratricopeptide repeat protein [Bdellovibrionota bacterium]